MTLTSFKYLPNNILSQPGVEANLCGDFLLAAEKYHHELALRNLPQHQFDLRILENFRQFTPARQLMLIKVLNDLSELMEESGPEPISPDKISIQSEIFYLRRFLKKLNLKISDNEFLDQLTNGELIEIYDLDGIQLYRSWSAFQFCSYSIDQLMTYDWNTLFERPSHVVNYLFSVLPDIFASNKTLQYTIDEYLIKERFTDNAKAFFYKMNKACAVLDYVTNEPKGFVTTATARMVTVEKDDNISFI